ncbi:MAG TPA: hypothetical protein VIJ14_02135 [Rhabdochlamydiaceae bacterium]
MRKILSLFVFFGLTTQVAMAIEISENYKTSFILPVDWSTKTHRNLCVDIPISYKSLQAPSTWDTAPLIEFIPKGENEDSWSEIITIQNLIESQIQAKQMTSTLIENISRAAKTTVLFQQTTFTKNEKSVFIIKYKHNGKEEVLGAQYLSGPFDCVGVQYTVRLSKKISENEAVKKIKTFFDQNLAIVES